LDQHLRAAGLAPPEIEHTLFDFKVVIRNRTVLDQPALEWLAVDVSQSVPCWSTENTLPRRDD